MNRSILLTVLILIVGCECQPTPQPALTNPHTQKPAPVSEASLLITSQSKCAQPSDCGQGYCLHTTDGGRCVSTCHADADCEAKWHCVTRTSLAATKQFCLPAGE
jgi:hypothetical protein